MFDYLQQFNSLPADLRAKVSSPSAMKLLSELETKYQVDLAALVMKVMIKSIAVKNLPAYLAGEFGLGIDQAEALVQDLKKQIFFSVADYLGLSAEQRSWDLDKDINLIIKEAGLILPSAELVNRLKSILATYVRGIRNKIDTKASLAKPIVSGGLSLVPIEIEKLLKVCDQKTFAGLTEPTLKGPANTSSALDKLINANTAREGYDLKKALLSGETKPVASAAGVIVGSVPVFSPNRELPNPADLKDFPVAPITPIKPVVSTTPVVEPSLTVSSPPVAPIASTILKPPSATIIKPAPTISAVAPAAKIVQSRPLQSRPAPSAAPLKPRVQDIRPVPKVTGPIEELQLLDPLNFRRLGANPAEVTAKILNKIKLLEKDGYDKMILGVKAWRNSIINRLYLKIFQEAIAKGLPLKEVVAARAQANRDSLSMEELEAIIALNSKLVF